AGGPAQGGVQQYEGAHGKSSQQSDSAAVAARDGEGVGAGGRPILRPLLGGVFEQLAGLQPVVDSGIGPRIGLGDVAAQHGRLRSSGLDAPIDAISRAASATTASW